MCGTSEQQPNSLRNYLMYDSDLSEREYRRAMDQRISLGARIKVYYCPPEIIRMYSLAKHVLNLPDIAKPTLHSTGNLRLFDFQKPTCK